MYCIHLYVCVNVCTQIVTYSAVRYLMAVCTLPAQDAEATENCVHALILIPYHYVCKLSVYGAQYVP